MKPKTIMKFRFRLLQKLQKTMMKNLSQYEVSLRQLKSLKGDLDQLTIDFGSQTALQEYKRWAAVRLLENSENLLVGLKNNTRVLEVTLKSLYLAHLKHMEDVEDEVLVK